MSISNIIDPLTKKIYPELIPPPALTVPNLNQVLNAGNSASTLGDPQTIENLDELETQKVYQGNYLQLELGEAGDTVLLKGTTPLGVLHVGNGVSIEKLPVGANGTFLSANSGAVSGLGVEWVAGGGGGGVASVSAGTNISMTGTATNPIVNLSNPLTSSLNLGTQSASGTTGSLSFVNVNVPVQAQVSVQAGGVSTYDTSAGSQIASMSKSGFTTQDSSANLLTIAPTAISKTGATGLTISSASTIDLTPSAGTNLNANVSGAGKLHVVQSGTGGDSQPAMSVENNNGNANGVHLDLYKNSSSPAVSDSIGGLSFHGNSSTGVKTEYASIDATILDPTNASQNSSLVMSCCINSATPSAFFTCNGSSGQNQLNKPLDVNSQLISTTVGAVQIANTLANQNLNLVSTGTNGNINITKTGSGGNVAISNTGGAISLTSNGNVSLNSASEVQIIQPNTAGSSTKLGTDIAYKKYYPDTFYTNNNTNTITVPASTIIGERMTLVNYGVSPLFSWNDITVQNFPSSISTFFVDTVYNAVWVASGNQIFIYDTTLSTSLGSVSVSGSSYSSTKINAIYGVGGFVYIGGDFTVVNSNAQAQFGLSRINRVSAPYTEDPMWDSGSGIDGVNGYINTITADATNGNDIIFSGYFSSLHTSMGSIGGFDNIVKVSGTSTGGMNTFTNDSNELSANAEVYCSIEYNGRNWFGGVFSFVAILGTNIPANYIATYIAGSSWTQVDGNNFNGAVLSISNSITGNVYSGGSFTHTSPAHLCLLDSSSPSNPYIPVSFSPLPIAFNGISAVGGFDTIQDGSSNVWVNGVSYGQSLSGNQPSGVAYFNGSVKTSYSTYNYFREPTANAQNAMWSVSGGLFRYNGSSYTNYNIGIPDQGQQFVGDGAGNWRQLGYNPWGGFS